MLHRISPGDQGGPDGTLELATTQFSRVTEAYLNFKMSSENGVKSHQVEQYIYLVLPDLTHLYLSSTPIALTRRLLGGQSITLATLVMGINKT
jgi:hypothetical protein